MKQNKNWRKVLSLLIVSVLVIGGLTVIAQSTSAEEEGELLDTIELEVTLQMESGVGAVYDGELDLFMQSVDGHVYQSLPRRWREELSTWTVRGSYNNFLLNPAHEGYGTPEIGDAEDEGWIDEPEDVRWLANDKDGEWTVNPFAHEAIRFAMQYINRQQIVEDLMEGFGSERFAYVTREVPVWQDEFEPYIQDQLDEKEMDLGDDRVIDDFTELRERGDDDMMKTLINAAMAQMEDEIAFGEIKGDMDTGWIYDPPEEAAGSEHDIEIKILARVEDWRLDLGEHMSDVLSEYGFDAWVEPVDSATAIPMAFYGEPEPYDNLDYHIYTGGWISTATVHFTHAAAAQMYAPWYGFLQNYDEEERWNYDEEGMTERVVELSQLTEKAFTGAVEDETEYWDTLKEATFLGFEESVRVFLATGQDFFPYDGDSIISAVTEATNGYDTYFGPRTMFTEDGELEAAILTGEDRPYMDNWNIHGGSDDVYGEYQRRMAREYSTWSHPRSGIPTPINTYWMDQDTFEEEWPERTYPYEEFDGEGPLEGDVEFDYHFEEDDGERELIENITVPDDAVDYFPEDQEWKTVDEYIEDEEDRKAAVAVTYDVHEEHEWHDGTDFDIQDLMWSYARGRRLGTDTDHDDIYFSPTDDASTPWWNSIHALEFDREAGTYTVYGDYTFPVDPLVGQYYSMSVEANQWTYEGWDHLHAGSEYDYGGRGGQTWIHQLSPVHMEDLLDELEDMLDRDYLPEYLNEDNIPDHMEDFAMDMDEVETQINSVIDFIEEYNHAFIGMGPFVIEEYDTDDHTMTLEEFDDYGFPDGYWTEQFLLEEPVLDSISAPREVAIGDTFDVEAEGHWRRDYPPPREESPLTEDHLENYRITVFDDTTPLLTVESGEIDIFPQDTYSEFEATDILADVDEGGHYRLEFEVRYEGLPVIISQPIILYDPDVDLTVITSDIPEQVDRGEEGNIWLEVMNDADEDDTVNIYEIDEETGDEVEIASEEIGPGESEIDVDHTFEEIGYKDIEVRDGEDLFVDYLGQVFVSGSDVSAEGLSAEPIPSTNALKAGIDVRAANAGDQPGEISLEIEGDVVETYEVPGYDSVAHTYIYEFDEVGNYSLSLGELETYYDIEEEWLQVSELLFPNELLVDDEVIVGGTQTIEATVEGYEEDTVASIYVDAEEQENETIPAGERATFDTEYTFDDPGEIEVEVRDEDGMTVLAETVHVLQMFELDVTIEGEGEVDIDPDLDEYVEGDEVTLTAEPAEDYYFAEWTGDYEGTEEEITITMDEDKEITAVFREEEDYFLDINIEGEGTVEVDGEEVEDGWTGSYEEDTEVDLEAIPDEDWAFDEWEGTDETGDEITITMDEDKEITAVFTEDVPDEYELTINIEGEGTVEVDGEEVEDGWTESYGEDTEVDLEAIPDEDRYFDGWTGDYEGTEEEITITMDEDKEITAEFTDEEPVEPANFEVTIDEPEDGAEFEEGDEVTVEFTVENTGEEEGTQDIVFSVDGEEVETMEMTIDGEEEDTGEFTWEAEEEGDYDLEVASDDDEDTVSITVEEDTPGFTLALFVLAAVVAVAIYYKKKE